MNNYNFYNHQQAMFSYVNNLDEANSYLLTFPSTVYLKDRNTDAIYEKTLDYQGRYSMKVYKPFQPQDNKVVTREEFLELQNKVNELLNRGASNEPTTN